MGRRTRAAADKRNSPEGRRRALLRRGRSAWDGAKVGALAGGAMAAFALLVGAGRLALALLGGGDIAPTTWHDARVLAGYVLLFVAGGALVGAVHAVWASRLLTTGAFMTAGALLTNGIAYMIGSPGSYDRTMVLWMTGIGCILGLAAAYGMAKEP